MPKILNPAEIRAYFLERATNSGALRKRIRLPRGANRDTLMNMTATEIASRDEREQEDVRRFQGHRKTSEDIADEVLIKVAESFSPEELDIIQRYVRMTSGIPQQLQASPSSQNQTYPEEPSKLPQAPTFIPPVNVQPPMNDASPGREDIQVGTQPTATSTLPMASLEGEPAIDPRVLIRARALRKLL